jgi:hypothetical protein
MVSKYRSRGMTQSQICNKQARLTTGTEALKSLLTILRSPSPEPLEERDVGTLSSQEMRTLLRRQGERGKAAEKVKQEGGIKRERSRDCSDTIH